MKFLSRLNITFLTIMVATSIATKADAPQGKKIYQQHCVECHGAELQGAIGSSFIDHVWNYGDEDWAIGSNVKFGIANLEMPAWKDVLNDDEIKSVVTYIMDVDKSSSIKYPEIPTHVNSELHGFKLEILDDSLVEPWSIAFINENSALVTDKVGKLYQMQNGKINEEAIKGIPDNITNIGQSGLLDVMLDPDYAKNGWVYLSYSHELKKKKGEKTAGAMTRIIRGHIKDGKWVDQQVLFQAPEERYSATRHHYGSRIVFDKDGYLYFTVGDRGAKEQAQDVTWPNGKLHRIHKDGTIPKDNPFVNRKGAIPSIFSYGHRNQQGMSVHPITKEIWATEHGPMGGDELNHIRRAKNFGWPEITYGVNYDGSIITEFTAKDGMEQPAHYWTPSIAVSDIDFYNGNLFPKWKNNLFVTSLKYKDLRRLVLDGDKVVKEEIILKGVARLRGITVGPDGAIYVLANSPSLIIRLSPDM